MKKLSVIISDEDWQRLREQAFKHERPPAVYARELLQAGLQPRKVPVSANTGFEPAKEPVVVRVSPPVPDEAPKEEKLSAARQALLGWKSEGRRK